VIIEANPVAVRADSSGYFDVVLINTGASFEVGAFSFGVSVLDPSITFTDATTATASPYIFDYDSMFGPGIGLDSGGQTMVASDVPNSGAATVAAGATVGLARIFFNTGAGFNSNVGVTFLSPDFTNLSDPAGNPIMIDDPVHGVIKVASTGVPEPATGWPVALAVLMLIAWRIKKQARPLAQARSER
jgi:hypothetical protein